MIKAYLFKADNNAVSEIPPESVAAHLKKGDYCWLDIESPVEDDFTALARRFKIQPLTMKQIRNTAGVPKLISGEELSYICWYGPSGGLSGQNTRFSCVFGESLLVTIREGRVPAIERNLELLAAQPEILGRGIGVLLYNILDAAIDDYYLIVDGLSDLIDKVEDAMFAHPGAEDVKQLFALKRQMIDMRRIIEPEREVVNSLLRRELNFLQSNNEVYFQDLYDHLVRIIDLIDTLRDVTSGAMQIYQATISNNLNTIMKQLTIIATIMMPLTLISGIFGMNVTFPYRDTPIGFWVIMSLLVAIGAAMLVWVWKRKWI
jgi:magnesium transporter